MVSCDIIKAIKFFVVHHAGGKTDLSLYSLHQKKKKIWSHQLLSYAEAIKDNADKSILEL